MNAYEEKLEARRAYYERKAEEADAAGTAMWQAAHKMGEAIPFGQPILVGHHSERGDRAYRERMTKKMDNAVRLHNKADYYREKAEGVGKGGISAYDPDASSKLEVKLTAAKERQELMKAANKAVRLKDTAKGDAKLAELGFNQEAISKLRTPDFCGRLGFPDYELRNNNANIKRMEARIKALARSAEHEGEEEEHDSYTYKVEEGRVQFVFDGKPEPTVRNILKRAAFKWSPARGAWVRQATANAMYAAERVKKELDDLEAFDD